MSCWVYFGIRCTRELHHFRDPCLRGVVVGVLVLGSPLWKLPAVGAVAELETQGGEEVGLVNVSAVVPLPGCCVAGAGGSGKRVRLTRNTPCSGVFTRSGLHEGSSIAVEAAFGTSWRA